MEVNLNQDFNVQPQNPVRKYLNPRLASIMLICQKINQIGNGVISDLNKIDEYSHQKELLLQLRSKIDDNFDKTKLSEEDQKTLNYLEEKGLPISSKSAIDNHLSTLNLHSEMEFRKINNEMSERASIIGIGKQINQEKEHFVEKQVQK